MAVGWLWPSDDDDNDGDNDVFKCARLAGEA